MVGYGLVIPLLPFYTQQHAAGAALVGLLGSLYAAMQFVGGPFLGGLSDRTGRRPVLVVCLLGASLAYLLLGLAETLFLLFAAVVLAGAAGGTLATAQAYIADSTSPQDRARGLGLIGAAFGLGLMAGPALGGFLSLFSLHAPAFAAAALALCNAAFGFFVLPESLPRKLRVPTSLRRLNPLAQLRRVLGMRNLRWFLLTALVSRRVSDREQGRVMGGLQAVISLTLVVGPVMAGLAFDNLGLPAPYWIGAVLAASALLAASRALLLPGRSFARQHAVE